MTQNYSNIVAPANDESYQNLCTDYQEKYRSTAAQAKEMYEAIINIGAGIEDLPTPITENGTYTISAKYQLGFEVDVNSMPETVELIIENSSESDDNIILHIINWSEPGDETPAGMFSTSTTIISPNQSETLNVLPQKIIITTPYYETPDVVSYTGDVTLEGPVSTSYMIV